MTRAIALLALGAFVSPLPGVVVAEVAAPETTEVFTARPTTLDTWVLAHRFLLLGSEVVERGGRTLAAEADYRLDADAGTIRLAQPLREGESFSVRYAWVPLDLPRDFVGVVREEPTPADSLRIVRGESSATPADRLARIVDEDLTIGGAKTVAIEVGSNQDASVEQSLRVSVNGRIGEDVKLTALLSDQNIPLQPEGNTQRLEELDEVLIRVDAPRGEATLGDFVATRDATGFGDLERRLSGGQATVRGGPGFVRGVGGSARGEFRTLEFRGVDGKQGPYVLAGAGLNPTGVIVAGSERVWADGRQLTRGDAHDYVIDYSRGEIEFTNRLLITKDTEIAVDFEVAEQAFRRNFYLGETAMGAGDAAVRWRVGIASETDDHDPLNITLDDDRRAALEAAGDSLVLVPGAVCGVEEGDYVEVGDHFEYAGVDSGTCDVAFTPVGAGAGDYVRDRDLDTGLTFFRFVGEGFGDFTPGLLLAAPRASTLADTGMRIRLDSGFSLDADGAFSREDRNTLSGQDDRDNEGSAGRAALGWERPFSAGGASLRAGTRATVRSEAAEFRALGRTRPAYLGEVWNFADSTRADETVGEWESSVGEDGLWKLGGVWGVFDRAGRFRSERTQGGFTWTGKRVSRGFASYEVVRREDGAGPDPLVGDLRRTQGELTTRWGVWSPGVTYWREERDEERDGVLAGGADDVEGGAKLAFEPSNAFRASARFARRTTDVVEAGNWTRQSVGRTYELQSQSAPSRTMRARFSWIHRELDFVEGRPETDRTTNLTRTDFVHEHAAGLFQGEYVYETTSRFVRDLLATSGPEEPSLALAASARVRLAGLRGRRGGDMPEGWRRYLALFESETVARVEEETTAADRGKVYRLDFSRFQNDATTVFGKILLREEITLFPDASAFSLTARWERIDTEDNRADPARVELLTERRVLRARNRLAAQWTLESQGSWLTDRRLDSGTSVTDFDVRSVELREDVVWQPGANTRLSGRTAIVTERNDTADTRVRAVSLGFAGNGSPFRSGRVRGDLSWTHPISSTGSDFDNRLQTQDRDEIEWRTSIDVRLSETINASISYSGRALDGSSTRHIARAEVRALF